MIKENWKVITVGLLVVIAVLGFTVGRPEWIGRLQVGEWYDECPQPAPTWEPYVQETYTPEPTPTCKPTWTPQPTYTPLPTSTPYPTQPPWTATITATATVIIPTDTPVAGGDTANPNASENARRLLAYITDLSSQTENRLVSGQMAGHGEDAQWGYNQFVQNLYNETGKWVGLIGFDYAKPWQSEILPIDCETINPIAIEHWSAGGLVAFTWLERNPWTGGEYHNRNNPNWDPRAHDLRELVEPGPMNDLWLTRLDSVASCLEVLRNADVPVLWRPFPEATYDATQGQWGFWWNSPHDPPAYVALWRHMFDYFTVERGLDNLLWVYNSANQDNWRPLDLVYPGDDVVDIVSLDVYADTIIIEGDGYNRLLALGKPIYFAETGPAYGGGQALGNWDTTEIVNAVRTRYPEMFAFMTWFSWDESHQMAIVDNQNASALLNDSWVVTREEIDY